MSRMALILTALLCFCGAIAAQQKDADATKNHSSGAGLLQKAAPLDANAADDSSAANPGAEFTSAPAPGAPPGTIKRKLPMPPVQNSNVAYIDSAIVGSQIRIRFDAAFHDNVPDRAEFFYPQWASGNKPTTGTGPNYPGASDNVNFQQLYFQAEYAPVSRFSIFTEVPIRWIEPQHIISNTLGRGETPSFQTLSGISDVRAGLKVTLAASSNHALTFQFKAYAPSGDGSQGLGTDHYSIEPSLLYYQRLSQRWAVESQIGDWHPIGGSMGEAVGAPLSSFAGDVFFYGIGPSYQLIDGEHIKFAPVVELFGWNVRGGLETINPVPGGCTATQPDCSHDASGTNIINLKVGARTMFGAHSSFYVGYGNHLTHSVWYKEIVRIEYRYSF